MITRILFAGLLSTALLRADETPLSAIKASVELPEGWHMREQNDEGAVVYQFTRENVQNDTDPFTVGVILSVTTKIPERNEMKPSAYAADILATTQEDGAAPMKGMTDGAWQVFRANYQIESDSGTVNIVNLAKANDTTGTLYFLTWQSPASEEEKIAPLREKLLASLKFDPTF